MVANWRHGPEVTGQASPDHSPQPRASEGLNGQHPFAGPKADWHQRGVQGWKFFQRSSQAFLPRQKGVQRRWHGL